MTRLSEFSSDVDGYSSDVDIQLEIGGITLSVGRIGPNYAILRESEDIDQEDGTIVITIDGERYEHPIVLPNALSKSTRYIEFF